MAFQETLGKWMINMNMQKSHIETDEKHWFFRGGDEIYEILTRIDPSGD